MQTAIIKINKKPAGINPCGLCLLVLLTIRNAVTACIAGDFSAHKDIIDNPDSVADITEVIAINITAYRPRAEFNDIETQWRRAGMGIAIKGGAIRNTSFGEKPMCRISRAVNA